MQGTSQAAALPGPGARYMVNLVVRSLTIAFSQILSLYEGTGLHAALQEGSWTEALPDFR
jgi:hypothetical protein